MSENASWRAERERRGITQAQLAERAGVSERTVRAAEGGGHVSAETQARLLAALGTPPGSTPAPPLQDNRITPVAPGPVEDQQGETRIVEYEGKKVRVVVQRHTDLPVVSPSQAWDTVSVVRAALADFERGYFGGAADIVEAMQADDRIKGVVSQRIDGLLGLPFKLAPEDDDDASAAELAEEVERLWPRMAPQEALRDLWKWGRFLGIGIAEKLYDTASADGWVPTLKVWHPRYTWWNWATRSYWINTQNGPVEVKEGDPHWVIYAPFGYYRGWMEGLIRALAIPWLFRQFGYRDWGRYNEVHGIPIRKILEPANWEDGEKREALRQIASLASESIVRMPRNPDGSGFDLELVEATSQTYDAFRLALEAANVSIAIVVLGQNLTSEVKGGAYSAAQVHERVAASLIRSDADTLSRALRQQMLLEWAALNFGPEAAAAAPKPKWDTEPPEDKGAKATALKTTAEAISSLRSSQLPVDFAELAERHGIPLLEGVEIPEYVPPAPPVLPGSGPPGAAPPPGRGRGGEKDPQAAASARMAAAATTRLLASGKLARRRRAPFQGQAYVDELAVAGRDAAAKALAGDVRALRNVIQGAKAGPDGKVDGPALQAALLEAYKGMREDQLAAVMAKVRLLAELSGRYAVTKEVLA